MALFKEKKKKERKEKRKEGWVRKERTETE